MRGMTPRASPAPTPASPSRSSFRFATMLRSRGITRKCREWRTLSSSSGCCVLVLVVVTLFAGVKTVPQGQVWTVERFGAYTRMLQARAELRDALCRSCRPQAERAGAGGRHSRAERHHPRQRDRGGGRDHLLPGDGAREGGLSGHQPHPRADHAGDDQHPRGDRRDGAGRHAVVARADQHRAAGDPGRRDGSLGRQGQPRRDPQDRAAGEPDPRDEPADDRRARAARRGGAGRGRAAGRDPARRGREAGADPGRRGPPAGRQPRRRGARAAGPGRGEATQMVADAAAPATASRPALFHRRPLRAGVPGAGAGAQHPPGRGADGESPRSPAASPRPWSCCVRISMHRGLRPAFPWSIPR